MKDTDMTYKTTTGSPVAARNSLIIFGWEAGIRTPIGGFRVRSPTVRRPPSIESQCTNPRLLLSTNPILSQDRKLLTDKILVDFPSRGQNGWQSNGLRYWDLAPCPSTFPLPGTNAESLMTDKEAPSHANTEESA